MLLIGQQSTFPKLLFIENRMKIERLIEEGLLLGGSGKADMEGMATRDRGSMHMHGRRCSPAHYFPIAHHVLSLEACFWSSCSLKLLKKAFTDWRSSSAAIRTSAEPTTEDEDERPLLEKEDRRAGVIQELKRQGSVFYDDSEIDGEDTSISEDETAVEGRKRT